MPDQPRAVGADIIDIHERRGPNSLRAAVVSDITVTYRIDGPEGETEVDISCKVEVDITSPKVQHGVVPVDWQRVELDSLIIDALRRLQAHVLGTK